MPAQAYLATHYEDVRRAFETWRVYYENGQVMAFDGQVWWQVCLFSPAEVAKAKQIIRQSGLLTATDLEQGAIWDTARLSYSWRLPESAGTITNHAYPARQHPVFILLNEQLDQLEPPGETDAP